MAIDASARSRLAELASTFLRLGVTAFGGPIAHIALMDREFVERRRWLSRESFNELLAVSNLIPGPTSTELAMQIGRLRAGWAGLVVAGLAFILPSAVLVSLLAEAYVRGGHLPFVQAIVRAVQPVVLVVVLHALLPLARGAIRAPRDAVMALGAAAAAAAGVHTLVVLIAIGLGYAVAPRVTGATVWMAIISSAALHAAGAATPPQVRDLFAYFAGVGSLLFGSGQVLLPVLHDDLVERLAWVSERQLLDAVAAGQATPGPVFTTATFLGHVIGGPLYAAAATAGIFLPAFVFAALSSAILHRVRRSRFARDFLAGVAVASVALIAVVLASLAREALVDTAAAAGAAVALVLVLALQVNPGIVLLLAAVAGAAMSLSH